MKERGRSNYQDKSGCRPHFPVFLCHELGLTNFSSLLRSLQDSVMDPSLCTSGSGANETHPTCCQQCSRRGSCHPLQPWTTVILGQDQTLHRYVVLRAHGHSNHLSPQSCQMYSYASWQRKYLSMSEYKVVRFHFIQEVGNIFEQVTCPKCFMDSHPQHSHWPWDCRSPPAQHLPMGTCRYSLSTPCSFILTRLCCLSIPKAAPTDLSWV